MKKKHAFPLLKDYIDVIISSKCNDMTVLNLRDTYHTLKLALESQKYLAILHTNV